MLPTRTGRTPAIALSFLLGAAALLAPAYPATAHSAAAHAAPSAPAAPAPAPAPKAGSIWGASYFPDAVLTSHSGKKLRFFTDLVQGKVVLINFIYTSCPDECGLETARLREVQRILGDRVGRDVFLYSITIDPANDTAAVLKEYAEKFQAAPGWLFLTGKDEDITLLRKKLGLYTDPDQGGKLVDHNLSLIMGNQSTGQWMKISPYENPYVVATQLGAWLHNWKMPPQEQTDYADAPKLRNISTGENLFRTRCSACHTIGARGAGSDKRGIGPDLLGVTRNRDHKWLTRWLADTDKMLVEKDPLAMQLLAAYNNVPMPNLHLNDKEVDALVAYLDAETTRLEQHQHHQHSGHQHGGHQHGGTAPPSNLDMSDMKMDDVKPDEMEMHEHGGEHQ